MSKTTLELLIESYEYRLGVLLSEDSTDENLGQISEIEKCIQEAEDLLQSEREQRIDDYVNGMFKGNELHTGEHKIILDVNSLPYSAEIAEQYFTQTYKKD